jgi:hypothetical protein
MGVVHGHERGGSHDRTGVDELATDGSFRTTSVIDVTPTIVGGINLFRSGSKVTTRAV